MPDRAVVIRRYSEIGPSDVLSAGLDAVFFESSLTKNFESDAARAAFRERWLGRYLRHDPQYAFVAISEGGAVVGYVIGSIDDPALAPRFADLPHFQTFSDLTRDYPAQLHVNLSAEFRGGGIGRDLVARFVDAARAAGAGGAHVVTGRGARNVAFYNRCGFLERGGAGEGERALVFLARPI